jgi:hypothetical protein
MALRTLVHSIRRFHRVMLLSPGAGVASLSTAENILTYTFSPQVVVCPSRPVFFVFEQHADLQNILSMASEPKPALDGILSGEIELPATRKQSRESTSFHPKAKCEQCRKKKQAVSNPRTRLVPSSNANIS